MRTVQDKPFIAGSDRHHVRFALVGGGYISLGRSRKADMIISEHPAGGLLVSVKGERMSHHLVASWSEWDAAWSKEIVDAKLVRDYFDAVDDAKATGDGDQFTVSRGAALRRLERADEALRQAVRR